jgi:two-component sensor histidine kinase
MKPHFWIFFLLFSYNCVVAQSNDVRYQLSWVNADDGLKQLSVRYCLADNYGFFWIATELGLYRYDGINLKAVSDPRYPSISKQRIVRLGKDKVTGKVYFETSPENYQYVIDNNQISLINPKEYWRKAIFTNSDISFSNSNTIIRQVLKKIKFQKLIRAYNSNNFLLACLDSNYLYINYLNRFLALDKNGKFKDLNFKTTPALFLLQFNDQILAIDKSSITLINNGYLVNKHIDFDENIRSYLEREIVNQSSLEIFSSGTNYYLKAKGKVYRIDYKNYKLTTHFLFNAPADDISSISYLEKDKVYLVGTRTQGLAVLRPVLFNTLSFVHNSNKSINFCYSVVSTYDDTWYSASGWTFNSKNSKVKGDNFLIDFLNTRFILPYKGNFYVNAKDNFWNITTKRNDSDFGFPKFKKPNSEGFIGYTYHKGQLYLADANSIYYLKKSVFETNVNLNKYLKGKSINGLGSVGNSIIIPTSKGVYTYLPNTYKIDIVKNLENVNARYIKPINNESYWVGCYGDGLFFVFQNKAYKVLMNNGVLSTAHAVEADAKGNFWISTNDGLLRTDKSTLINKILKNQSVDFYIYTTTDGLLTNEFNGSGTHPSLQTVSGIIGFPSMKGFVYFDSNTIPKHNFDGTIVIDQVLVDNRKTIPFLNNTYIVPKEANYITFKFSYGYYFNRDNISIYYRFKNQNTWTKVIGNSIQFNRYKKGEQQLIIKITTNGIANHKAVTKKVSVFFEPRYYELAWFWFLIGLGVMLLFYFLYLLLFNFQRNRNKYLKSLVDEKTHELNQIVLQLEASKDSVIQTLSEKEILLKEIHHRVKNNLQLVMSLLNIQAQDSKNISIEDFLEKGRSRIATMSLIHQNLYENSSLSKIDFQNYLENLASNILNTFNENTVTIAINTNENDFDVDTAIPLGLIINELLCNSLKHAFKNTKGGIISIHLSKVDAYNFVLEIGDNGVGTTKNSQKKNSIGLDIVSLLVMQLRGTIIAVDKPGTNYRIEFKEANK